DRAVWLDRLARRLARREQTTQVRIARELLARCRSLTRSVLKLERELSVHTQLLAPALLRLPGCGPLGAAKLLCESGPIERLANGAPPARPRGRRPARGQLRQAAPSPARPRRQPPAQLRPAPDRGHPGPRLRTCPRLSGAQAGRGQEPSRGAPLPQA